MKKCLLLLLLLLVLASNGSGQVYSLQGGGGSGGSVDLSDVATLDEDGELENPGTVMASVILKGAGPPAAGSCPHNRAIYSDSTTLGDTYVCYAPGGNWSLIGENDDSVIQVNANTSSVTTVGPTTLGIVGSHGITTSANNTTKVVTITPATKSRIITIIDVASTHDDVPMGRFINASTIASIWCSCNDVTGTLPTFTLSDGAGNAMTITGTNPTCNAYSAAISTAAVTAGNALSAGEELLVDTTNSPTAGKTCEIGVTYTID